MVSQTLSGISSLAFFIGRKKEKDEEGQLWKFFAGGCQGVGAKHFSSYVPQLLGNICQRFSISCLCVWF